VSAACWQCRIVRSNEASLDKVETPEYGTLREGVLEAEPGGAEVLPDPFRSRMLPGEELKRLDIVRGGGWPSTRPKMVPEAALCSFLWIRV
jgi:hypothetical protein